MRRAVALAGAAVALVSVSPLLATAAATAAATATWWAVFRAPRAGVIVIFATLIPAAVLAALMTVSQVAWNPTYRDLADQQLAGVIMWGFGGAVVVGVAVGVFASVPAHAAAGGRA